MPSKRLFGDFKNLTQSLRERLRSNIITDNFEKKAGYTKP
jgi:hypothetical protein